MASLSGTTDVSNHLTPDFLFCEENLRPVGCDPAFGLPLLLNSSGDGQ